MLIVYFLSTLIFYYVTSEKHVRLFSKTRTTFLMNMYDFPVKHNRVFKLIMFSDLYFCIIHALIVLKIITSPLNKSYIPPCRSAARYVSITGCLQ